MNKSIAQYVSLSFGNIIEWYDFSLSIYFVTYISKAFFPNYNHFMSLLLSFATFFIGFLSRPLGAVFYGWLGEKYPLKKVLHICILIMALSTFAIACLPTYLMIGALAPILLLICRLLQGASAGAQFPGLLTLSVREYKSQKCFLCSISYMISTLGFLLASIVGFVLTHYFSSALTHNLWRVPYAISLVLFIIYWFTQRKYETDLPEQLPKKQGHFLVSLTKQYFAFVATLLLVLMGGALYFFFYTYIVTYYINHLHFSESIAYLMNSITLIAACFLYPLLGKLADQVNSNKLFIWSWLLILILIIPFAYSLQKGHIVLILAIIFLICIGIAGVQAVISPMIPELFKGEWQASNCAIAYSIGVAISGAIPMTAHILVHWSIKYGISILIAVSLLLGALGLFIVDKYILNAR